MLYGLVENAKPSEEYLFFSMKKPEFDKSVANIYVPFRKFRERKRVKVRGIHRADMKGIVEPVKYTEDRFLDFPLPPNMAIFRDKVAITSWGEVPTGILITSKDVADQYRELFWELWRMAKK